MRIPYIALAYIKICQYRVLSLSLSRSLKILLAIKSECIDFDKKRVTKNVTLKTNKQRMLFVKKYRIFKFQACQGLLIILQKFI